MHNPRLIPFFIFGSVLILALTLGIIISVIIQKQRQFRNRLARQQLAFDYSQSLLNTRIEVQETTLNTLSQELHDNVTQMLTGCVMQITGAAGYMEHEKGKTMMEAAKGTVKDVIRDVRLLSHSLATGLVERRDVQTIQAELDRIQAFSNIACSLDSDTIYELPSEQRLLLFRIIQEALQNVVKHAEATHIAILINATHDCYNMTIADDGLGFETGDTQSPNASLGLANMKERAAMLKGTLNITSTPGKGTTIIIQIPIDNPGAADTESIPLSESI